MEGKRDCCAELLSAGPWRTERRREREERERRREEREREEREEREREERRGEERRERSPDCACRERETAWLGSRNCLAA